MGVRLPPPPLMERPKWLPQSVRRLQKAQAQFRAERPIMGSGDTPSHLVARIKEEADEVLDGIQWGQEEPTHEEIRHVGDELADVTMFVFNLANLLGIDMQEAITRKMAENREKYPSDMFAQGLDFQTQYHMARSMWERRNRDDRHQSGSQKATISSIHGDGQGSDNERR